MNLSKTRVTYIKEIDDFGGERYYKRQFLSEMDIWGVERKITKATFNKREKEGYKVEYRKSVIDLSLLRGFVEEIKQLIDLALDTKDKEWFDKLVRKQNMLRKYI